MKPPIQRDESSRFRGSLRHYHRAVNQNNRTWEEWIDGRVVHRKPATYWLKMVVTILGSIILVAVVIGLYIELR
jgi:hypothetical protein